MSLLIAGCGPTPVTGGTKGMLRAAADFLSEVQVTVHHREGDLWKPIGFAVTASDGSFELVTDGARGPLVLEPGEYRCTLESVGAPVELPAEYQAPLSTPLQIAWSGSEPVLELVVPIAPHH